VTNPPIDSIREEIVMSLECFIGPEGNLLETTAGQCHRLAVPHPILTDEELDTLQRLDHRGWKTRSIDITWPPGEGPVGLRPALDRICREAEEAIAQGYSLVVLSDRACSADRVPISALLACGAVHHHLIRNELRTRIGIVLETGEAREVHHFCLLAGYGADAVNPYLAFETLLSMKDELDEELSDKEIVKRYIKAVDKGILKVMSKMGISTYQSYCGAQIFDAI